jgi:hypothetical protein
MAVLALVAAANMSASLFLSVMSDRHDGHRVDSTRAAATAAGYGAAASQPDQADLGIDGAIGIVAPAPTLPAPRRPFFAAPRSWTPAAAPATAAPAAPGETTALLAPEAKREDDRRAEVSRTARMLREQLRSSVR